MGKQRLRLEKFVQHMKINQTYPSASPQTSGVTHPEIWPKYASWRFESMRGWAKLPNFSRQLMLTVGGVNARLNDAKPYCPSAALHSCSPQSPCRNCSFCSHTGEHLPMAKAQAALLKTADCFFKDLPDLLNSYFWSLHWHINAPTASAFETACLSVISGH